MLLIVVIAYLLLTVVIGAMTSKKNNGAQSFHGAGLGVLMCVAAGAGEWMGGTSTTGVSEYGYLYGISGAWYTIANGIGIMFCAIFFAKLYRSLNTPTIPGIVGHYIGEKARVVASCILIFVMLAVGVSQMIAIGSLGKILLGVDISASILILGAVVILYTLFGGMLSVGYTNTLHLIVMYIGMALVVFVSIRNLGGIADFNSQLPEGYTSPLNIGYVKVSSWIIASVLGACTAQAGIQPILAAKDEKVAVKSSIITALIVAPFGILTALLGMAAKIKYPELANAKLALPVLMQDLPIYVSGVAIAAIMAAVLSTASPIFLSCGTLFTKDIYLKIKPNTDNKSELKTARIVTAVAGILCVLVAYLMFNVSAVLDIVYFAYSMRGSLFIILLFGIYSKKVKIPQRGAIISMMLTALTALFWVIYKSRFGVNPINSNFSETYAAVSIALISILIVKFVSANNNSRKIK